ncbi:MAG TPA: carbohydrate ABC transporter permease [Gaiellaceae bacterium]|nr:carbohydrate ABC transporter permease [Gaiellaceae bacterium]
MRVRVVGLGVRFGILATFAVFFIGPVLWLVLAPTKSDKALITSSPFSFGSLHQVGLAWKHLNAFSDHIFRRWIENTLYYALSATAITLVVGVPAGYGLALGKFPGRRLILSLTLIVMIMPAAALVLPIFLELNAMHLIGRSLSVILPFAFFPFGVYLAYIYYVTALPRDLLDAARVDGAGELQTFLRVALPLAKPVVALVFFFSFVADWNNFFLPYVVLANSDQYPITVGLDNLLASTPSFNPAVGGGGQSVNIFKPELALATLIAVVPVAIVFLFSQRALVRGLVGGAVKE